jgi:cobalt-zinc-cadmium efflux system outer membrane protein
MKNKRFWLAAVLAALPVLVISQERETYSLGQLISLGLNYNPTINAEKQSLEAAQAAYSASRSFLNPAFDFSQGSAKSYDGEIARTTRAFSITQPIENPFKRHFRVESQKNRWQAAEFSYDHARKELVFNIKIYFYQILLLNQKEKIANKNLEAIGEIYRLIKKRADLGEVKELEAIKLFVETRKAQKDLNQIRMEKELTEENLNCLIGNILSKNFILSGEMSHSFFSIDEETLIQLALSSQPLIQEKAMELKESENTNRFLKWQRLPDFYLTGFSRRELDGKNTGIGISFEIPLWNWRSAEIKEAVKRTRQKELELQALKNEVITEVRSKLKQLQLSTETLKLFSSGLLTQAAESLKIAELSYTEGEISLIDYLDSQRTYNSIILDFQEALYRWHADKAALEKAVGEEIK